MPFMLLAYIDMFSGLLPIGAGLIRRAHLRGSPQLFYLLVLCSSIVDASTYVMGRKGIHNLWLIQLYHLTAVIVTMIVLTGWQHPGRIRTVQRVSVALYTLFWFIAKFSFEPISGADQFTHTIASVLILCSSIICLFQLVNDASTELLLDCRFWIAGGVMLYYAVNVALFSGSGKLIQLSAMDAALIWNIHWGVSILVNLLFTRGFIVLSE
jgi:hypothetical protein